MDILQKSGRKILISGFLEMTILFNRFSQKPLAGLERQTLTGYYNNVVGPLTGLFYTPLLPQQQNQQTQRKHQ